MIGSSTTRARATTTRIENTASLLAFLAFAAPALPALGDETAGETPAEAPAAPPDTAVAASPTREPEITKFPGYPAVARRDRIEGEATVCFKVAPDGRVLEAAVASSTHEIFEEPSLEAIEASTFEPLAPGEELVPTICRTYRFRLDSLAGS